ncbi:MAG: ATP-grasp domain-containing protein, partial [Planctomycetota bacterium]|nr:ATP-grasp domain-containing protein [Planctomycetota bacterium]
GPFDVMEIVHAFHTRHRWVELSVDILSRKELLARLRGFEVDVGVFADPPEEPEFSSLLYNRHPVRVIVPAGHRLARRKSLSLKDLDGEAAVLRDPASVTRRVFEQGLQRAGVKILGTTPEAIHLAEDREAFEAVLEKLGLAKPPHGMARTVAEAEEVARRLGYPVVVRPSYVLGGRGMAVVHDHSELHQFITEAASVNPDHPVLIDQFLEDAIEVDVDLLADRTGDVVIGGVLEHIEEAGVHSGDASCVLPPYTLPPLLVDRMREASRQLARELGVDGLMNVQYAVKEDVVYVLEANPRASRTVPFISKATGVPLAMLAARVMTGRTLEQLGLREEPRVPRFAIKKSVFPWARFPGCNILLGPEMRSTGEVMGLDRDFAAAFAKAQAGASERLEPQGSVLITVRDEDKRQVVYIAKKLSSIGYEIVATRGTYRALERHGVERLRLVHKIHAGRPDPLDLIRNGEIGLIINTPSHGRLAHEHEKAIRALAVARRVPCFTTIPAAAAAVGAIEYLQQRKRLEVEALQDVVAGSF